MGARIRVASVGRLATIGGDENRLLQTALAMDPGRVEHVVIVVDGTDHLDERERQRWAGMRQQYAAAGVEVVELAPSRRGGVAGAAARAESTARLARELRRRRIDVVDARSGVPAVMGVAAATAARTPVVTLTSYYTSWFEPLPQKLVGQAMFARLDALISDAQATLDDFDTWRWSHHAELALVQNGILPATSELTREEARAALGLWDDPGTHVVGHISRLLRRKAHDVFLRAAATCLESDPDLRFAVVGFRAEEEPDTYDELLALRDRLGLVEQVRFVSHPGPVGDAFRAIDTFAHLSLADSSPIAIHEGMSLGKPSVISALPGNRELVDDGVTGLLVPPGDHLAAAEAFLRLAKDPDLAERIGAGARARYLERHRPEIMAANHLALWERLLARHGRR